MEPVVLSQLRALEAHAVALTSRIDADLVPAAEAPGWYEAVDHAIRALTGARTVLARRVADSQEWQRRGFRSPEELLAATSGSSLGAAKTELATSRHLEALPAVQRDLLGGALSAEQGVVIADAAAANPAAQHQLLTQAGRSSLRELRAEAGRTKAAADPDPDATYARIHAQRRVTRHTDTDGAVHLHAVGTAHEASEVLTELDRLTEQIFRERRALGTREQRDTYVWDALVRMARRSRHGTTRAGAGAAGGGPRGRGTTKGGNRGVGGHRSPPSESGPRPGRRGGAPLSRVGAGDRSRGARLTDGDHLRLGPTHTLVDVDDPTILVAAVLDPDRLDADVLDPDRLDPGVLDADVLGAADEPVATNPKYLGLLRIDLEALRRGAVEGEELCEISGVGPVPVRIARELLGEATLKLVITRGVDVCNVTSLGRGPTAAMRYATAWTSPTCTVEGCTRTIVEHDHIWGAEWRDTRHTRLDELEPLCTTHHGLHTREGWALVTGTGKRAMVSPADPRHPSRERHPNAAVRGSPPTGETRARAGPEPPGGTGPTESGGDLRQELAVVVPAAVAARRARTSSRAAGPSSPPGLGPPPAGRR